MSNVIQVRNLEQDHLRDGATVIVVTAIASSFKVRREGRWYVAENRVEFCMTGGTRYYRQIGEMRADLARR